MDTQNPGGLPATTSVREAARMLGISVFSFYTHVKAGRIRTVRLGRTHIVRVDELQRLLDQGAPLPPPPAPQPQAAEPETSAAV